MNIFVLCDENQKPLDPKVQATILAKYSRSPDSALEIMKTIDEAKAEAFQEKFVVAYGHASVAELGTLAVCFENVSIVASKVIESFPRAAYSEKSTRYQQFSAKSFVHPSDYPTVHEEYISSLYASYEELTKELTEELLNENPKLAEKPSILKARVFDNTRYLLPAGTGTNVGVVANLLDFNRMIVCFKSHKLLELQHIGEALQKSLEPFSGPLMRHTGVNNWEVDINERITELLFGTPEEIPYPFSPGYSGWHETRVRLTPEQDYLGQISLLLSKIDLENRPSHSQLPDIFRLFHFIVNFNLDYGAYRDLQRHRRCTQFSEPLGTLDGYEVPEDIQRFPRLHLKYTKQMDACSIYCYKLGNPSGSYELLPSQYFIPMGFKHRSIFHLDLQELFYIIELRTKKQGHISYRRAAYELFLRLEERYPCLMKFCRVVDPNETTGEHT